MTQGRFKMFYVLYLDHVLYMNVDPVTVNPCVREAVGWVVKENDDGICLCFDKPARSFQTEKLDPATGLFILKSDILEKKEID